MYGRADRNPNLITRLAVDHLRDARKAVVVMGGSEEFSAFVGSFVRTESDTPSQMDSR